MRLFVGIPADEVLKKEIKNFYEKERKPKGSWVKIENLHITLKFIGEVEENKLKEVLKILKPTNFKELPFEGASAFPNEKRPRVLFLKFKEDEEFLNYQRELENKFKVLGFEKEEREFKIHLTLARFKFPPDRREFEECLKKLNLFSFSPFKINEIVLFQSILKPEGPTYIPLEKIKCIT